MRKARGEMILGWFKNLISRFHFKGIFHCVVAGAIGMIIYIGLCTVFQVQKVAGLHKRFLKR